MIWKGILFREMTKNPMVALIGLQRSYVDMGEPSLQHYTDQAFMLVARQKPLLSKRHMTAP